MAQPIDGPIKGTGAALIALVRNGVTDAASSTTPPNGPAAIAFVARQPPGTLLRPAPAGPPHGPLVEQLIKHGRLVLLAWGEHYRQRLALAFGTEMDFGAESALAAAERLGFRVPPFAPAAC